MEHWWNDNWQERKKKFRRKVCSPVEHKSQMHYLGIDTGPSLWEAV
jgi:hypothetical protein